VFARIGDDLELHEPPILPYGRVYRGHDGFREIHAAATAILDLSTLSLDYLFGDEERVCAVVSLGLVNRNRTTILEEWQVRDGRTRWGRVFRFTPEAIA
jgi:hypothetical protein